MMDVCNKRKPQSVHKEVCFRDKFCALDASLERCNPKNSVAKLTIAQMLTGVIIPKCQL